MKNSQPTYLDGSEESILALYGEAGSDQKVAEILANNPPWALRYHLAPEREQLLSWYPFKSRANLLEVGAGCGALTGLFCRAVSHVTAVELTESRAAIIRRRHHAQKNLEVITGNIDTTPVNNGFDYVTSIGVLEYAGRFTPSENPALDFIHRLKSFLKPNGHLIIAIENKFGLKYWAGAPEDHTGRYFDSLENYPHPTGIQTFSKKELVRLLEESGFSHIEFYYPLPDYKFPVEVFSDHYPPTLNHNILMGLLPAYHSHDRQYLFNEKLVMDNVIREGVFDFFTNSFLIFAS